MPQPLFTTTYGQALVGDSLEVLADMEPDSVDLVVTSPPFALLRQKDYGNRGQDSYVEWLSDFGPHVRRVLKESGSYVIDLGGAYRRGVPVRSLYNFRVLIRHVDEHGFALAQEFFWHNPSKLPSPIEWVNKRKIRAKDTVNTVWWLSKTDHPKADVRQVLAPYSDRMRTLLKDPDRFYKPKKRPSGHDIGRSFGKDNGGAIPPNLLQFANSESNGQYLRMCKEFGIKPHPARFPRALPEFFVKFLTEPGDVVVDIFAGSGTTGETAEVSHRKWMTIDIDADYVRASVFRFVGDRDIGAVASILRAIDSGEVPQVQPLQCEMAWTR
jgi:site-specific DNA-methyltransferase (cytosine-N4-specific)